MLSAEVTQQHRDPPAAICIHSLKALYSKRHDQLQNVSLCRSTYTLCRLPYTLYTALFVYVYIPLTVAPTTSDWSTASNTYTTWSNALLSVCSHEIKKFKAIHTTVETYYMAYTVGWCFFVTSHPLLILSGALLLCFCFQWTWWPALPTLLRTLSSLRYSIETIWRAGGMIIKHIAPT